MIKIPLNGSMHLLIKLLFVFVFVGCKSERSEKKEVDAMNLVRIENIFEKTKVICFGRFLVELPHDAIVTYGPTSIEGETFFRKDEAHRLSELVSEKISYSKERSEVIPRYEISRLPLIGNIVDGAVPGQKIIFAASDSVSYSVYSFVPVGNDLFVQEYRSLPDEDILPVINEVAKNIHLRTEVVIPVGSGVCTEGGFISMNPIYERVAIGIRFEQFPDVRLSIDTHKNQDNLPLENSPKKLRDEARTYSESLGLKGFFSQIKILRDGIRSLGDHSGEEIATRRPRYKDDTEAHEFRFHSVGRPNDALGPEIDIRLDSGVRGNSRASVIPTITDEEALALWDKIISTLRLRQSTEISRPDAVPAKVPLGTILKAGDICSQTGWWECIFENKRTGQKRKRFNEGERLPYIMANRSSEFLRGLLRNSSAKANAEWRLIDYDNLESPYSEFNNA